MSHNLLERVNFEGSIKDLHPKIQEQLRKRLVQTEENWNTEAKLWYRGILGKGK